MVSANEDYSLYEGKLCNFQDSVSILKVFKISACCHSIETFIVSSQWIQIYPGHAMNTPYSYQRCGTNTRPWKYFWPNDRKQRSWINTESKMEIVLLFSLYTPLFAEFVKPLTTEFAFYRDVRPLQAHIRTCTYFTLYNCLSWDPSPGSR